MNIRDIKRKKITEMTTDEILAERKFYEDVIANCKYEKPQDIADLFEAYTMLIWKHKQVGRVYDFYFDGLKEEVRISYTNWQTSATAATIWRVPITSCWIPCVPWPGRRT